MITLLAAVSTVTAQNDARKRSESHACASKRSRKKARGLPGPPVRRRRPTRSESSANPDGNDERHHPRGVVHGLQLHVVPEDGARRALAREAAVGTRIFFLIFKNVLIVLCSLVLYCCFNMSTDFGIF